MFGFALRRGLMAALLVLAGNSPAALLITPAQLNKSLNDPKLVILQVGPKEDYAAGHIPGARLITLEDIAIEHTSTGVMLELPDSADLRARLEKLGISNDSWIVVTGGADWVSPATRVVFTLQAAGLGDRTQFLDGGEKAWARAGFAVTKADPPTAKPGHLTLPQYRWVVVDHAWIQSHEHDAHVRIIDARAPVFYEGVGMPEHGVPGGHIAGAKNIPFNSLTDDSTVMLPVDSLRKIFAAAGVQPGDTVAAYCHIGQQGTVVVFAARLIGNPARLYDGSMTEWQSLKLPIENPNPNAKPTP
jgi:thiosulfate/3-mercaptopyruvate sulfurtransferase